MTNRSLNEFNRILKDCGLFDVFYKTVSEDPNGWIRDFYDSKCIEWTDPEASLTIK